MELKILCPTCKGSCWVKDNKCTECINGFKNPPQEVLDTLECAEIERFIEQSNKQFIVYNRIKVFEISLRIHELKYELEYFKGETKLEALRKAKEWLDKKGGE